MIFKLRFGKWRLTITLAPVLDIIGVNSLLEDGNHIPMWDFDDVPLEEIVERFMPIQWFYQLPNIYILNTGKPNHYIAYCFKRMDFMSVCSIIATTPNVCENFYKWGVFRHRFTLRVSPKVNRIPRLTAVIVSPIEEDVTISDLKSWVGYETLATPRKGVYIELAKGYSNTRRL